MFKGIILSCTLVLSSCASVVEVDYLRNEVERVKGIATQANALAYQCLAKCDMGPPASRPPRFPYR